MQVFPFENGHIYIYIYIVGFPNGKVQWQKSGKNIKKKNTQVFGFLVVVIIHKWLNVLSWFFFFHL